MVFVLFAFAKAGAIPAAIVLSLILELVNSWCLRSTACQLLVFVFNCLSGAGACVQLLVLVLNCLLAAGACVQLLVSCWCLCSTACQLLVLVFNCLPAAGACV